MTLLKKVFSFLILYRWKSYIHLSGYFDKEYYLTQYPDVAENKIDPLSHFLLNGALEYRNPSAAFNTAYYITLYKDVYDSGLNPLLHYLRFGKKEKRSIHPKENNKNEASNEKENTPYESAQLNEYILLLDNSGLFDEDYYVSNYPDVAGSDMRPIKHYLIYGWKEFRNPSFHFNTSYYLLRNPDVKQAEIPPIIHYINSGKIEGRLPKLFVFKEEDCSSRSQISELSVSTKDTSIFQIAVVIHIYYVDLMDELLWFLNNIPFQFHLYCSTTRENEGIITQKLNNFSKTAHTHISIVQNYGRDIVPFLHFLKNDAPKFDVICKIHTKKSPHKSNLSNWRTYLLQQLLGSQSVVETILNEFLQNQNTGMIWPVNYPFLYEIGLGDTWGSIHSAPLHKNFVREYLPHLNEHLDKDKIEFPAGSMFWFRPKALEKLPDLLNTNNFSDREDFSIDGTKLHAIERCFGLLSQENEFVNKTIYIPNYAEKKIKSIDFNAKTPKILFVTHDLCQQGAQQILCQCMHWINRYTHWDLHLISIEMGSDGGQMYEKFNKICDITLLDQFLSEHAPSEAPTKLLEKTGTIDLIYGNTLLSAKIYGLLQVYNAPILSHIHELQSSIEKYIPKQALENAKKFTTHYIACADEVSENLQMNHGISADNISTILEFIQTDADVQDSTHLNNELSHDENTFLIIGCGTISWRKGTDLFIQTAQEMQQRGYEQIKFVWIGPNFWDYTHDEGEKWSFWEKYLIDHNLTTIVHFTGIQENPLKYFAIGDVFYLSSREDPFPLVCLEAANNGLPLLCFEKSGGISGFIDNKAGTVVTHDIKNAADAIENYIKNPDLKRKHGGFAQNKVKEHHSSEISIPRIFNILRKLVKKNPLVSIIVPVYNQGRFLPERLKSIYSQTFLDFEVIILDDASTDNSFEIATHFASHVSTSVHKNDTNSGSPFIQWEKGIQLAKGEFIWIAEGDDSADDTFLHTMLSMFTHPTIGMAYSASHVKDENNHIKEYYYLQNGHYSRLGFPENTWEHQYLHVGTEEVQYALSIRNTIPNASAVLFRSDALKQISFNEIKKLKFCGDWLTYISILINGWDITYSSKHLNYHRKHSESVVSRIKTSPQLTLQEYGYIHQFILSNVLITEPMVERMIASVTDELFCIWPEFTREELKQWYDFENLYQVHIQLTKRPQTTT